MADIIVISGQTASGKSQLALNIAQKLNCSIINADSRQCFIELNIGTAKPSKQELKTVPHYFVNSHSIFEHTSVGTFETYADHILSSQIQDYWVVCGGTGLYIKSLIEGIDLLPAIDFKIREQVNQLFDSKGINALIDYLYDKKDPFLNLSHELKNSARIKRAVEVRIQTGLSIVQYFNKKRKNSNHRFFHYAIDIPNDSLHQRINSRVDLMIENGLESEVKNLTPYLLHKNLQTVGYQEWIPFFKKEATKQAVVEQIKLKTRQYAKRQKTWLRSQNNIEWLDVEGIFNSVMTKFDIK